MPRKTIDVEFVVEQANAFLRTSANERGDARRAIMTIAETVLHDTGNYRGFRYLRTGDVPEGHSIGIIFDPDDGNHEYPDVTRVQYY